MSWRRHLAAVFGLALVLISLLGPVSHQLSAGPHHNHMTCAVCQSLASAHDAVLDAAHFTWQPELSTASCIQPPASKPSSEFDHAVALARGPPSCLEV